MLHWFLMLFFDLFIPVLFLVFGYMFTHGIPDRVNGVIGYRTRMSMQNDLTWAFAHQYVGRLWRIFGLITLPLTVVVFLVLFFATRDVEVIGWVGGGVCFVQSVPLVGSIIPTERALHRHFHKDGTPKITEE